MADEGEPIDSLSAYCVDEAVLWFGARVENDLADMVEVGMGTDKRREPKYTLADLLDDDFRVPRPLPTPRKQKFTDGLSAMLALAAQGNGMVKRWEMVKPS